MAPSPAKLLPYMQIHPWWHRETHLCPNSSLLHDFFPSGTVGPASSLVPSQWYSGTQSCKTTSQHANSSLVGQWDPPLPNFFPTSQFLPSGTVGPASFQVPPSGTMGPIPAKLLPYMQIYPFWHSETCLLSSSCLVVQWALPPL